MGRQFSSFLSALYRLYEEKDHKHGYFYRNTTDFKREYSYHRTDGKNVTRVEMHWDGESYGSATIILSRENDSLYPISPSQPDPVNIIIRGRQSNQYTIDGRDLCYAVAKAYTEALKKYGFKGFDESSSGHDPGDFVDIDALLFIKAYALDALEVRDTKLAWRVPHGCDEAIASTFEKEMELLLFDM